MAKTMEPQLLSVTAKDAYRNLQRCPSWQTNQPLTKVQKPCSRPNVLRQRCSRNPKRIRKTHRCCQCSSRETRECQSITVEAVARCLQASSVASSPFVALAVDDRLLFENASVSFKRASHTRLERHFEFIDDCLNVLHQLRHNRRVESDDESCYDEKFAANLEYLLLCERQALAQAICLDLIRSAWQNALLQLNVWTHRGKIGGDQLSAEFARIMPPLSTTWPWSIRPSLAVLWGVCWMFYNPIGDRDYAERRASRSSQQIPHGYLFDDQPLAQRFPPPHGSPCVSTQPTAPLIRQSVSGISLSPDRYVALGQGSFPNEAEHPEKLSFSGSRDYDEAGVAVRVPGAKTRPASGRNPGTEFATEPHQVPATASVPSFGFNYPGNHHGGFLPRARRPSPTLAPEEVISHQSTDLSQGPYNGKTIFDTALPQASQLGHLAGPGRPLPSTGVSTDHYDFLYEAQASNSSCPFPTQTQTVYDIQAFLNNETTGNVIAAHAVGPALSHSFLSDSIANNYSNTSGPMGFVSISPPRNYQHLLLHDRPEAMDDPDPKRRRVSLASDSAPMSAVSEKPSTTALTEHEDDTSSVDPSEAAGLSPVRRGYTFKREGEPPRNEEGKFICTVDGGCKELIFDRKCEWGKHMDKHERPYRCRRRQCSKLNGFTYSGGLLRHEREVHRMHGGTGKPLFCSEPNCKRASGSGNGFTRRENLQEHMRRVHRRTSTSTSGAQVTGAASHETDSERQETPSATSLRLPIFAHKRKQSEDTDDGLLSPQAEIRQLRRELSSRDDWIKKQEDKLKEQGLQLTRLQEDLAEMKRSATT